MDSLSVGKGTDVRAVSVIIPTYDRANMLPRAIDSVARQTWGSWELVVVDDGSTDCTEAVVSKIDDPRVKYLRHHQNRGAAAARNTGIRAAKGRYIAFLDSDDEWLPEKLETQLRCVAQCHVRKIGVVYSRTISCDRARQRMKPQETPIREGDVFTTLLEGWCPATTSSVLVARESLIAVGGFDENLQSYHDYDLWLKLARSNQFHAVDEPLVIMHEHDAARLSTESAARAEALEDFIAKWGPTMRARLGDGVIRSFRRKHMSSVLWNAARESLKADDRGQAARLLARSVAMSHRRSNWKRFCALLVGLMIGPGAYESIVGMWRRLAWERCSGCFAHGASSDALNEVG